MNADNTVANSDGMLGANTWIVDLVEFKAKSEGLDIGVLLQRHGIPADAFWGWMAGAIVPNAVDFGVLAGLLGVASRDLVISHATIPDEGTASGVKVGVQGKPPLFPVSIVVPMATLIGDDKTWGADKVRHIVLQAVVGLAKVFGASDAGAVSAPVMVQPAQLTEAEAQTYWEDGLIDAPQANTLDVKLVVMVPMDMAIRAHRAATAMGTTFRRAVDGLVAMRLGE